MSWLAAVAIALWPVWAWSLERFRDGTDEPWGVVAVAALALLVMRDHRRFRGPPHPAWLLAAAALACAAIVTDAWLPPLARGVLASLAIASALAAVDVHRSPSWPLWMLALLSLPLLSSLQFFLGYPLRVVTAEASGALLQALGHEASRSGSALTVNGQLVIVDAPCAGIHMAWAAYFTAAVTAAWMRLPARAFLLRLPVVGALVLVANVLRNTLLVAMESARAGVPAAGPVSQAWHDATGLAAFTLVCGVVLWHMQEPVRSH